MVVPLCGCMLNGGYDWSRMICGGSLPTVKVAGRGRHQMRIYHAGRVKRTLFQLVFSLDFQSFDVISTLKFATDQNSHSILYVQQSCFLCVSSSRDSIV